MRKNQKEAFQILINEICDYFALHNIASRELADSLMISQRTLQYWKSGKRVPYDYNLEMLYDFLLNNNANNYAVRLEEIMGIGVADKEPIKFGVFAPELDEEDKKIIRDNFPSETEFRFLCGMLLYRDKVLVIEKSFPELKNIEEIATLIANYDYMLKNTAKVYGINGIEEWEEKIIRHLKNGRIPSRDENIEIIGQEALDSLVCEYCKNKKRREQYEEGTILCNTR